jgi:hypothetical protein
MGWTRFGAATILPLAAATAMHAAPVLVGAPPADPFTFFRPDVVVSENDRQALARGDALVHVLPSRDHEVAVFVTIPVRASGERLIAWMRDIVHLKQSRVVQAIGRFSATPRIEDLAGLRLDDGDVQTIRRCRPSDCGLKLTAAEISTLQAPAGAPSAGDALQSAFRRVVLARVEDFARAPVAGPGEDDDAWQDVDAFVYWSKERLAGKPIISATSVRILKSDQPDRPEVLVREEQIFATHYIDDSSSIVAMLRGSGGARYLAYLNRSDVDVLGHAFGGMVRMAMEHRVKSQAPVILRDLRDRIEGGWPPGMLD